MIDLAKLKNSLPFGTKPRSNRPNKVLELRITVQAANTTSGLLWDIGDSGTGPQGGQQYVRNAENSAGILGMLGIRLDDMEREVRTEIASNT